MKRKSNKSIRKAADIQKKFDKPVRSPKREIAKINKQLRSARSPIYNWNRKIKNAPSKYYARKYRKELKVYKDSVAENIINLTQKRSDLHTLQREFSELKKQKRRLSAELGNIEGKMKKARKKKDLTALANLAMDHSSKRMQLKDVEIATGVRQKMMFEKPGKEVSAPEGFIADPNNPYTYWQGVRMFDDDVSNGYWNYFIIAGKRMSGKNPIEVSAEGKVWFDSFDADSDTHINRYISNKSKTVKYTISNATSSS